MESRGVAEFGLVLKGRWGGAFGAFGVDKMLLHGRTGGLEKGR